MSDIALTSAMRRNLLSLQNTSRLMDTTSDRLSTGRKVNSALDNPSSFFTAQGLTNRAGDLSSLLDAMGQGLQTLKAAEQGIDTITELVDQAKAVADEAYEAAASADKGASLTIDEGTLTIDATAAATVDGGGTTLGTLVFTDALGNASTYTASTGDTVQEIADYVNNSVSGLSASFNSDTNKLELTATSGESIDVTTTQAFDATASFAATSSGILQTYTDVSTSTQLQQTSTESATITITTDNGTKTFTGATGATVGDLVDWLNSEVEGVSAKIGTSGLEITSQGGGFTFEGLDQSVLDVNSDDGVDGHYAGRTLTFGVKLSDTFSAVNAGETMEFAGSAISVGGITTGADLYDKLSELSSDWDVGSDSDGYVTLTYVGSSTDAVSYTADSGSGSLLLNDSSLTTNSSFVGTFNVSGSVDNDNLVTQFNDLLEQIDTAANDASYKGINLLNGSDLTINFNEDRTSSKTIEGVTFDATGLGFSSASGWKSTSDIQSQLDQVSDATDTLRSQSAKFGREGAVIQTRQDFTENMINTLQEGADELTLADMNEEGANMLALQTRQQLATSSLSMASQASQAVLSLFR